MKSCALVRCIVMAAVVGLSALAPAQSPAPENPPPAAAPAGATDSPAGGNLANTRQLVMDVLTMRLARELALNDEQTILMAKRFTEYRAQLEAFRKERQELTKALRSGLAAKEPDSDIKAKLKALTTHDARITEYKRDLYDKASEGLSITQRARLYVFLGDFENDMRKLIQKAREKTGPRPNRPTAPPATETAAPPPHPKQNATPPPPTTPKETKKK